MTFKPIKNESLVDQFVSQFEELILSGKLVIGQKLPPERELSKKMNVSRPVVHEGLIILDQKGLVAIKPRKGTFVSDYRKNGSLALLGSLLSYRDEQFEPHILESLMQIRMIIESETVRLAAINRSEEHLQQFKDIIDKEENISHQYIDQIVLLDFSFHHLIALASDNFIYPLLINSFKETYTNLTHQFFRNSDNISYVFAKHKLIAESISRNDKEKSVSHMKEILGHGAEYIKNRMKQKKDSEGQ